MYASFSPELNAVIDAGVAKYGSLELAKRFLFHYMRENGVTYGDAWQCLTELPESCFNDSPYFRKVDQICAKYAEIVNEDSTDTVAEYIRCSAKNDVLSSILCSSNDPISQLLYNACYTAKGLHWDYERIQDSFAELDDETGIPNFHPPAITYCGLIREITADQFPPDQIPVIGSCFRRGKHLHLEFINHRKQRQFQNQIGHVPLTPGR